MERIVGLAGAIAKDTLVEMTKMLYSQTQLGAETTDMRQVTDRSKDRKHKLEREIKLLLDYINLVQKQSNIQLVNTMIHKLYGSIK